MIENGLEPLVHFDIDTQSLVQQAERIQDDKQRIARQLHEQAQSEQAPETGPALYQ